MLKSRSARLVALLALPALALGCSDDDDDRVANPPAATDAPSATSATPTAGSGGAAGTFPVTVEHAFGETDIPQEPMRVVTWGCGSADAAIALGVIPAAIPFQAYGGDDDGVLPWIREALDAQAAAVPVVLPNVEEPPFEAIAASQLDVILAAYSGITGPEYELLSEIAPTVAYPGEAWATPWRDLVGIVGTALGRVAEAEDVLADIDEQAAAQASAHPELAGQTVAQVWDSAGTFYVYKAADPRVEFTLDLGLVSAPSVDELSTDESTFFFTLSDENLAQLTSDILVSSADTPEDSAAFLASPHAQLMAQVADGAVAEVTGTDFIASASPPTALSLTWGLEEYVELLSGAAAAADAAG